MFFEKNKTVVVIFQFDFQKEMSVVSFGPKRHFVPQEGGQSYDCAICLDPMYNEDGSVALSPYETAENASGLTTLGCGHENHTACLLRTAQRSAMCPECRAPYRIINPNQPAIVNPVAPPAPPLNVNQRLLIASENGDMVSVVQMIDAGADVNAANRLGGTPLMMASQFRHEAVGERLIAAGANVNAANEIGFTALIFASLRGLGALVEQLVAAGANVNAANHQGYTAIIFASSRGHEALVTQLIAAGSNVNAANNYNQSALSLASINGHEGVVARLIAAGANVNYADNDGYTAVMLAGGRGHEDVVALLVAAGARRN